MAVAKFPVRGHHEGEKFTLEEVISTLSAQRILINEAVQFLEELDTEFVARNVVIRVITIEEGSLAWDLLVELWGVYQKQITEKVTGNIEEAFDVDIPDQLEPLLALALMAVTYWGLRYAYDRVARRKTKDEEEPPPPAIHIEGNYNTVVNIIAAKTDTYPERVKDALNLSAVPDRAKIAKAAVDFVRPARRRPGEGIVVDGTPGVSSPAVAEVPSDAELARTSEVIRANLDDAELSIRGTDRDNQTSGWRAVIEDDDRFPKRLPLVLSPAVDPEALANFQRVRAAVTLEGDQFMDGSFVPRKIHLQSFEPAG